MAATSHSLGGPSTVTGHPAGVPQARAASANRYTDFKHQIQHVLGWKKGVKQPAAGESRSEQGTQSVPGKGAGLEQGTQSVPGKGAGSEQGTQSVPGQGAGSEQGTQSVPGKGAGSEQGTQSVPGKGAGLEQDTQSVPDKGAGLEQGTQSVPGKGAGLEQGTQSVPGKGAGLEQGTVSVPGKGAGLEQGTVSVPGKGAGLEQGTVSVPGKGAGLEQGTVSVPGKGAGLEQGTQPVSCNSGSEKQIHFVIGDWESEKDMQSALGKGIGSEQSVQSALGKGAGSEQGTQSVPGKGAGSEQGTQSVPGKGAGSEQGTQSVLGKGAGLEQGTQSVPGKGAGSEQTVQLMIGMNLAHDPKTQNVVDLKLLSEEEQQSVAGTGSRSVHNTQSAVDGETRSKQQTRPAVLGDVRSAPRMQPLLAWDKRSEQCIHLPLGVNRATKLHMQPFKCQNLGLEPRAKPSPTENAGLERQIFITLTRNLSHISGLYDSVRLADEFGPQRDQHSPRDGSHLGPGKRDLPRPTVRKRAKSCPGSPTERRLSTRSNRVRFADSLGLELAEVRRYDSAEEPTVPAHVFAGLGPSEPIEHFMWLQSLTLEFTNPKDDENFNERVHTQKVCLETVTVSELVISGTILVINLAFHKEVTVRYTCTDWTVFTDVPALFESSIEDKMDRFTFTLTLSTHVLQSGSRLQFAIKYIVNGIEFWDNNYNINYRLTYQTFQIPVPNDSEDSLVNFI
uniref:uncharacterized protein n=1 Tax=Pristiophorus japonicus TaxID=55135 RepID=UPI00398ED556